MIESLLYTTGQREWTNFNLRVLTWTNLKSMWRKKAVGKGGLTVHVAGIASVPQHLIPLSCGERGRISSLVTLKLGVAT